MVGAHGYISLQQSTPRNLRRRPEQGLLPIFMKQARLSAITRYSRDMSEVQREQQEPGAPRERQFIAITLWDSLDAAKAGVAAARAWVDENMSDELDWTDTAFVDVLPQHLLRHEPFVGGSQVTSNRPGRHRTRLQIALSAGGISIRHETPRRLVSRRRTCCRAMRASASLSVQIGTGAPARW
jgi:hypothetical protein